MVTGDVTPVGTQRDWQSKSRGTSHDDIIRLVLRAALRPQPRWLDIGCGTGDLLRAVHALEPKAALAGQDLLPWIDEDVKAFVEFSEGPAESLEETDRRWDVVSLVEVIEHLESPWSVLRIAARLVAPGGCLVVTTPNNQSLRSRGEFAIRGDLSHFRPGNMPHLTPAFPHVMTEILRSEALVVRSPMYAASDVVPFTGGRLWPRQIRQRLPRLMSVSTVLVADRGVGDGGGGDASSATRSAP